MSHIEVFVENLGTFRTSDLKLFVPVSTGWQLTVQTDCDITDF